ncbi:MAG: sulfur oxidation c-type cytochrome SoxX [Betaproteobacteria bacterium]|nr:sulfur oxidation c-type cytochrome SoxX [Betaproteobacteria bacterium]
MSARGLHAGIVITALGVALAASSHARAEDPMDMDAVLHRSFRTATPDEWTSRLAQDETQALCSRYRNLPPAEVAAKIREAQERTFRYPGDGRLSGDWRDGAKLAAIGTGGHIGRIQPDPPGRPKGGNCYACHELAKGEVAAGNLGPSLTGFGLRLGDTAESRAYTYRKIYNAQAFHACSAMPRFGTNGWLTPEQIADLVAYLLDPGSPVNAR